MTRAKVRLAALVAATAMAVGGSTIPAQAAGGGTSGWGWSSNEWWSQLGYTGKIWAYPCVNVLQKGTYVHALQGWLRYYVGSPGNRDTGKLYTAFASGCSTVSRTKDYWDDPNPWAAKTVFTKGWTIVPKGVW